MRKLMKRQIAENYIEGQPQVSAVPVPPDESGTEERIGLIVNMEAQNKFYPGYPLTK